MRIVKWAVGIVVFGSLAVFVFFKTHDLLLGTSLRIDSPENGATLNASFVRIRGEAPGAALLTVGGAKVLTSPDGSFQKELLLGVGYNAIEVKTLDRFNREKKLTLELVYRPSKASSTDEVALFSNKY